MSKWKKSYESGRLYHVEWEKEFPWVTKAKDDTQQAYCKLCTKVLQPRKTTLKNHGDSREHSLRLSSLSSESESVPLGLRQIPSAEVSESEVSESEPTKPNSNKVASSPAKDSEVHPVKPNFGYCLTLDHANELVKRHEQITGNSFTLLRSDPDFGKGVWNSEDFRIKWTESKKTIGESIPNDGIPFLILGTRHLGCQFASSGGWKAGKFIDMKKDADGNTCELKRESCPAKIILKEVIKFPDYKVENKNKRDMTRTSQTLRNDLVHSAAVMEPRIYIELPTADSHVHTVVWKKAGKGNPVPSTNCLVCNAKFSSSTKATVPIFSEEVRTSHRQLQVHTVLSEVLRQSLASQDLHSTTICGRCFSLLDDIDSLEEQLSNKKQVMVERFGRTTKANSGNVDSSDESLGAVEDDDDDDDDVTYIIPGKRPRYRNAKRGRPPGRPKARGSGRPRGRPRCVSQLKTPDKGIVNEEKDADSGSNLDLTVSVLTGRTSPPILKSVKQKEINSDMESSVDPPSPTGEDSEDNEAIVAIEEPGDAMVDQVSMELEGDVLEVVGEDLEQKKNDSQKYSCSECDKKFISKAAVRNHIKVHSHRLSYTCDECEKPFFNKNRFQAHMRTHLHREKSHKCDICQKSFYTLYRLSSHMKTHTGQRNYVCDVCGKTLSTQKTLDLHALTHSGERPFQCEICGATFRQKSNLHTHIKATHYQEKNHSCHICQKSFCRKRLLVYHMNSVHTGVRPYKCDKCSASFVYPQHYKRHLRKHNGEKPHKCHICSILFRSRDNLNAHLFIHTNKRPYECKICGAGFMRKPLCVAHVTSHSLSENPSSYIIFNSPSQMHNASQIEMSQENLIIAADDEVDRAVQTIRTVEGTVARTTDEIYTVRNDKVVKVLSRPVRIIESGDKTRYIIHTGDRSEENMEPFFAAIQGQVVEVQTEDF